GLLCLDNRRPGGLDNLRQPFQEAAAVMPRRERAETVPCPHCREEIYEQAERCPHCESYISAEDAPEGEEPQAPTRKPWWVYVGVLACLYVVYRWIVAGN